jgi:hypothetical protein
MKQLLTKLALTTAIISGAAMAAQACPQTTAMGKDSNGSFQLAQAGGGGAGGGAAGGAGGGTGAGPAGSTTGNSTSTPGVGNGNNSTSGSSTKQIIPPEERMRDPSSPASPPQPGSQTTR